MSKKFIKALLGIGAVAIMVTSIMYGCRLKEKYSELNEKYESLADSYNELKNDYNSIDTNRSELGFEYDSLGIEYDSLKNDYENINDECNRLESELAAKDKEIYKIINGENYRVNIHVDGKSYTYYKKGDNIFNVRTGCMVVE